MMCRVLFRWSYFLAVLAAFSGTAASLEPANLTCEYLINPLGIDTTQPRLSWQLKPTDTKARGQRQTSYRVFVASEPALLEGDKADLWDSRWQDSADSQLIVYQGKPLRSAQSCWWKVRVKDENGKASDWSQSSTWTMGLLSSNDWKAKWIGTDMNFERKQGWPPPDNSLPDPWLRKSFALEGPPKRALLYVASVGYHEVYINGRKVGDGVLAPATSDHNKRARYLAYDIAPYLRPGQNILGLWLGFSWSIFPPYRTADKPASPIVMAQTDIELTGGKKVRVATDESWRWHPSPNTTTGVWDFMHYGGELYDATKEVADWCETTADTSSWQPVKTFEPKLALSAQQVEVNRAVKELRPATITETKPGVWRVDLGAVFAGWLEAKVTGNPGDKIEFKWSERPDQEITHENHSFHVIGPSGQGTFRNHFNYGVGRWITIYGLKQKPELADIRGWLLRTDYQPATTFACSQPLLNQIYETTLWTYETLSLGGYVVDCAQRERMGYGGDAHGTTPTGMNNFKTAALYTKWAQDWRDVQGNTASWGVDKKEGQQGSKKMESGNLPYTAPTYWGGGGPAWSGYCVTLPWEMYLRYGDRRILSEMLPTIEQWLDFLETKAHDNLLRRYGGQWDFLSDWLWPGASGVNGDTRETLFFNNCYWVYNLQTASKIAQAVGRTDLTQKWSRRAEVVRKSIHQEFFNRADNSYVNGLQAHLSIALLTDIPPRELRSAVFHRLEEEILLKRRGHFWGGITGGSFIVKELIAAERPDLMFTMASKEDYPGWGDMLKRGATTIWEDWEGNQSLCHSSYLHIGAWFVEGLAGIRPNPQGGGYNHFVIRPGVWPGSSLEWTKCRFDSPYGPIESNWRREGERIIYDLLVPPNTRATVFLREEGKHTITESSKDLTHVKGVKRIGREGANVVLELQPGRYSFEAF